MANVPPILPPLSPVTTGPAAVGGQQNPPLPQLSAGAILQGTVSGADAKGNIIIKSDALRLVLNTNYPLNKGQQVALRLEQTLTGHFEKSAPPQVRIVSVDGKVPPQAPPTPPQSGAPATAAPPPAAPTTPTAPNQAALQGEAAKPVGVLLDIISRPNTGAAAKTGADTATQQPAAQQAPARGIATQVTLSEGVRATAVLLRPAASPRAVNVLTQLSTASPTPLTNPASALRPGLQLQVQVVQTTGSSASPTAPQNVAQALTSAGAAPSTSAPAASAPTAATPAPSSTPATAPTAATPTAPATASDPAQISAQNRSGYASYARQAPNLQAGAPQTAAPTSPPATSPTTTSTPTPMVSSAAQPPNTTTTPTNITAPQGVSPATPVNVPQSLTPQAVEQLLVREEAQPLPQGQLAGVVMGKEPGGAVIVQTRLGLFTLPQVQADSTKPGTVLTWQVGSMQAPQASAGQGVPIAGSTGLLATASQMTTEWSALSELTSVLQSMQSAAASQALQRIIPHVGNNMGAGLFLFINMLRKGDVFEWLGKSLTDQLEAMGKGDLITRLGADMGAVRSLFSEQQQGSWQALFFPVMVEENLEHAQMYLKQEEGKEEKKGDGGTRFIVELELSNLGEMQMDGYIKKRESATQFDLVMRTMRELPDNVKTDIYTIFENAQKVTSFNGGLSFRTVSEFPVNPLEEMRAEAQRGGEGGSILA